MIDLMMQLGKVLFDTYSSLSVWNWITKYYSSHQVFVFPAQIDGFTWYLDC